jgi:hypothetical protein
MFGDWIVDYCEDGVFLRALTTRVKSCGGLWNEDLVFCRCRFNRSYRLVDVENCLTIRSGWTRSLLYACRLLPTVVVSLVL